VTDWAENNTLIGGIERREIKIEPYDPRWPETFRTHAQAIAQALGSTALAIHHVGSTSVPELAAKPIVDMLLVVENSADEGSYLPRLEQAGYVLRVREPAWHEHRMLRTPEREVHLHVFSHGSSEIERLTLFRDRLRACPADRQLYEATKRRLAPLPWPDMNAYADAKGEVIERIIAGARDEA
jgi:GrpB-like predicted nucleotidyltransferase (UPF0157 family)